MTNKLSPKIRMTEFKDTWDIVNLEEVAEKVSVGIATSSSAYFADKNSGVPFIKNQNIKQNQIDDSELEYISHEFDNANSTKRVKEGDIVTARTGYPGLSAVVPKQLNNAQTFTTLITRLKPEMVLPEFLSIYINSEKGMEQINGMQAGGAQKNVNASMLKKMQIPIPTMKEQKLISRFILSVEKLISINLQELDALKQTKQGFLQRMFPKDGETVPEVRLPSFSDEWVPWKLSDITDLITKGTTPKNMSNEGLINFVKVENINPFSNQITSYSKISLEEHNGNLKRSQLKKNDILFSIAGTLGRTAIVKEKDLPANTNQALAILRMKNTNIDFITTYLKGKLVKDYIRKNPTIGAQPNLSLQQLKDLHVFLPSNQEQIKIGTFFRQIDEVIELKEQELEALKQTKKGFLQKMFV